MCFNEELSYSTEIFPNVSISKEATAEVLTIALERLHYLEAFDAALL